MFQILIILLGLLGIGCILAVAIFLIEISRENQHPDIEDVDIV